MTTELVLLGTAGAPLPVAGRAGISSALIVDDRVFVIDCGRGSPSAFVDAGLDFTQLEAIFIGSPRHLGVTWAPPHPENPSVWRHSQPGRPDRKLRTTRTALRRALPPGPG